MPLPFVLVCDLLDECHRLCLTKRPFVQTIVDWFARHRGRIDAHDTDLSALLSCFLPEKRTDRVYCIKTHTLERIIGRALSLGSSRIAELALYKQPENIADLADCVERILKTTPNPLYCEHQRVTVEEIDQVLHGLASRIKWSSPTIRNSQASLTPRNRSDLEGLYRRLSAREGKWLTRLVLKSYQPLVLDSGLIYRCCDTNLPLILQVQGDFATAIKTLQAAKGNMLPSSAKHITMRDRVLSTVKPKLGIKIGRQNWFKGRSIKHCLDMGHGRMSVEDKVDGEYCQIHIDVSSGKPRLQIFSKSGKDSTEDRLKLHGVIIKSLGLGRRSCKVRKRCILEGELVVHNDVENTILPFHKIRNHVARRGRLINVDLDSPPRSYEHLMIVYYDILLVDDQSLLGIRHSDRHKVLENIIHRERGRAELVKRTLIDFDRPTAASELRNVFAAVITGKREGLVLKADDTYFNFKGDGSRFSGLCIKLKKEYIGNFGDVGDFAVVGAGFNPTKAKSYKIPNLKWTVFYVGCLENKDEVERWKAKPRFRVVSAVETPEPLLRSLVAHGNPVPVPIGQNDSTELLVPACIEADAPLTVAFQNPPVFDLRCFDFDKPGNTSFWTLRFPSVSKIHFDRDYCDAITFNELQQMAKNAKTTPDLEDSQENLRWIAKLECADPQGRPVDAVSQLTATTLQTPSPNSLKEEILRNVIARQASQCSTASHMAPVIPSITELKSVQAPETRKRRSTPTSSASPPQKRRPSKMCLPSRRPLEDINGNTAQPASFSGVSEEGQKANDEEESIAPDVKEKPALVLANHAILDTKARSAQATGSSEGAITPLSVGEVSIQRASCQFAGAKCHLFNSKILLASTALSHSSERADLLTAHGVAESTVDLDRWLDANSYGATLGNKSPSVVILLDTVDRPNETKEVLARVLEARKGLPPKTKGWIAAYDWRMLGHLQVMEDENHKKKYYDGFCDPYRRWYCGIV